MTGCAASPAADAVVVVRGGRDSSDKLRRHALRTARAWSLDGAPLFGISVFAVVDRPLGTLLRERFSTFRTVHITTAGHLRRAGFDLLPTGLRPHFTVGLDTADDSKLQQLLAALGPARDNPQYGESATWRGRPEVYRVDINADLNDEDDTGCVWTFLDEARDPSRITPGALVVAGDQDAAAVCQVVDLVPAGDGTIVHLCMLPGLVEDYLALAERLAG